MGNWVAIAVMAIEEEPIGQAIAEGCYGGLLQGAVVNEVAPEGSLARRGSGP